MDEARDVGVKFHTENVSRAALMNNHGSSDISPDGEVETISFPMLLWAPWRGDRKPGMSRIAKEPAFLTRNHFCETTFLIGHSSAFEAPSHAKPSMYHQPLDPRRRSATGFDSFSVTA